MGGFGSGRHWGSGFSTVLEDGLKFDLTRFLRITKVAQCGYGAGNWIWTNSHTKEQRASIGYECWINGLNPRLRLHYTVGGKDAVDYTINLTTTPLNYGGVRYWMICPAFHNGIPCNKRCSTLFRVRGKYFFCRECVGLNYHSQHISTNNRKRERAQRLHMAIGGDGNLIDFYIPRKPKGMHRETWDKILEKLHRARGQRFEHLAVQIEQLRIQLERKK